MSDPVQEALVYGIVILALLALVWRKFRARKACEGCPIQRISRND